uniref:Uncharacterized protein n=1 Tax=Chlamydomonas leiostraca TaxID=1034604 RepID=A0A7S0X0R1_9CHLO|mmetsp:Transcript_7371/g.18300  ORF Transcript_7371/g.18300 Transcript_7371/m.18300 type:complete len:372 (+) Transcript_7371:34-1149(+)|eukprot:CAMPEP_0202869370 /NCGR_PEP_ID=MMETSP1391-20130828/12416_1 /ASSEMBLY_ACC=CAM_ASM_000867 /TAXON_ID=1034604 /ORGANISM="Chlamydomonas leiostraca, Strain SAG 11-49" /LENGTH=371 /DNA_ID=CAMNT_0049549683 /DNA_START=34 /DNA_END=1149 /DNA_ORIENTATION=+
MAGFRRGLVHLGWLAVLAAFSYVEAGPSKQAAMLVFGDSLSDVGNTFAATGGLVPSAKAGYWSARFTNSPGTWVDYISKSMLISSVASNRSGHNFAYGGATACAYPDSRRAMFPNAAQQYAAYKARRSEPIWWRTLKDKYAERFIVLWVGHNDFIEAVEGGALQTADDAVAFVERTVTCIVELVMQMVRDREPTIVVATLADLSYTPFGIETGQAEVLQVLVHAVNDNLAQTIEKLKPLAAPNTTLAVWDLGKATTDLLGNATRRAQLGFRFNDSCLQYKAGDSPLAGSTPIRNCTKPNDRPFYDLVHPSAKLHQEIAKTGQELFTQLGVAKPASSATGRKLREAMRAYRLSARSLAQASSKQRTLAQGAH